MRTHFLSLTLATFALAAVACGGDETAPADPRATTLPTAATVAATTPQAGATTLPGYGPVRRTGVAAVDAILALINSGNLQGLAARIAYRDHACLAKAPGVQPRNECPAGVAPGTVTRVVNGGGCETEYFTAATVEKALGAWTGSFRLRAVSVQEGPRGQNVPAPGTYTIYGMSRDAATGQTLEPVMYISDGKIEGFFLGCPGRQPIGLRPNARYVVEPPK